MKTFTLGELATYLGAKVHGDPDYQVTEMASLEKANASQVSFLSNPKYLPYLKDCQAGAVLLKPNQATNFVGNSLLIENPYLGFAKLSHLFDDDKPAKGVIHPSAIIAEDAEIDSSAHIGAFVVIEAGCKVAAGVIIGAHSVLAKGCVVGENTLLHPRVTLYRRVHVGDACIIHSGAVLGCDGYGFAPTGSDWEKIAQLGHLVIADQVEIGANTTIDRGALDNTRIDRDVKIDNLVHIAHNVKIGEHTAITAQVGIAGSTSIGANCMFGGNSGIAGHIQVCDNVQVTGMGMITGSINKPGVYSSGTGLLTNRNWRKSAVRFRQLEELNQKVKSLESQLRQLTEPE
ncbi:MAG TPA: UDP-3-O-(3-hydroxymyristoyl)glucosamine N-acyltransferase [Marinospirillum sp.]|uniref:UDP-3-O-(3-hydroxymyristoyl)glucosamine N-acyltransferase n=1 Tax=Marinospirillum sp. TaxID=2183934 RepID=UPI002B47397B|nr:UDP-3-O-(3-hydroxymyristoyl)glucosamine N-acyltransferase [Marinospirillum sp.]HKM16535.1 UDP-3-O-(3-hydroxymyristoyl)glucosamine N-acyltransferase [Marinospirillum sp.]